MLTYTRQRAIEAMKNARHVVLVTSGPAGVVASEVPCQAAGLRLYLLVPGTSDHLFNLEQDPRVTLVGPGWEVKGEGRVVPADEAGEMVERQEIPWCVLVGVDPCQVQIRGEEGWGRVETIDLPD